MELTQNNLQARLTTALEKLTFKVDIAGNRIKKQSNGVKQINKLLNA